MSAARMPARRVPKSDPDRGLAIGLGLLSIPFTTVLYGSVLAKLWEWFITDTFGVHALSAAEAVGVSMTVTFVTYQTDSVVDRDESALEGVVRAILTGVFRSVLVLALAFIVKAWAS